VYPGFVFLLAHLGIGLGLAWLLAWKSPARFDYRLVLFGSILPDLIDKPLGYALGLETRIWSHTFVFLFAILALSFAPRLWILRFVGFGVATHLLVDRIWEMPWVVLYPAYGWSFHPASLDAERWIETLLHDPLVQAGEVVGALILLVFAWRKGLGSWATLKKVDLETHRSVRKLRPCTRILSNLKVDNTNGPTHPCGFHRRFTRSFASRDRGATETELAGDFRRRDPTLSAAGLGLQDGGRDRYAHGRFARECLHAERRISES